MKIKSMTAYFGRLAGETLTLGEGLNILEGANEGGKSTWAAFIKAMLYGIDTRDRDRKGHLADKNKYLPWSGGPMAGEMNLEWQGRDITLRRGRQGNNPFGAFYAVYTGTSEPVPGLNAENCGEMLTGVGRETFERSAFIGQSGMMIENAPDLEKRIAALVSSGQEDVSYSQAEGRLKEMLNRRKVNKTVGMIPKLAEELAQTRETVTKLDRLSGAIARGEEEKVRLEYLRDQLMRDRDSHRRLAQQGLDRRFSAAAGDYDSAKALVERLEQETEKMGQLPSKELLKKYQGDLQYLKVLDEEIKSGEAAQKEAEEAYVQANISIQDPLFNGMTGEEARNHADDDRKAYLTAGNQVKRKQKLSVLFLVLAVLAAAVGFAVTYVLPVIEAGMMPLWAGLGLGVLCLILSVSSKRGCKDALAKAEKILARYQVKSVEELDALARDYDARWRQAEQKANELKNIRGALNDRKARRENTCSDLMNFVHSFAPEVKELFGCSAALSRALGIEDRLREAREKLELIRQRREDLEAQGGKEAEPEPEEISKPEAELKDIETHLATVRSELERVNSILDMALGEQKAVGDPAALAARQEQLEEELARREREYEAISVAMEALKAANAHLQERFSPELSRLAGAWMERLTDGRYTAVSLTRELEASAIQRGELLPRQALALSQGTVDQLYLAVRLAVVELCLRGEEPAPLVLDDALVTFDDERMANALKCLETLSAERQVLLFTCQSREGRALEGREQVTRIQLDACKEDEN